MLLLVVLCFLYVYVCAEFPCPLSSVLNLTSDFYYPVDIFGPPSLFDRLYLENKTFPCYSARLKHAKLTFNCTVAERFCPVHSLNVKDATTRTFGSTSLCHFKKRLHDPKRTVRVFVFGGSVTTGTYSQWCNAEDGPVRSNHHPRCSWFHHFSEWLKQTSTSRVEYYNLAAGSSTSISSAIQMSNRLRLNGLSGFASNDIIFLDHSCNDQRSKDVLSWVESLILTVYSLSVNNSWPSIVILDVNPLLEHHSLYPRAYTNMSEHYNLPMWSYREAVLSDNIQLHQSQIADVINFKLNFENRFRLAPDMHPPWFVHLFMADLFSAIFQQTLNNCSEAHVAESERLHTSPLVLPSPATAGQQTKHMAMFLSMSFDEVHNGTAVGSYSISNNSADSWSLREDGDRHGKGGFIIERGNSTAASTTTPMVGGSSPSVLTFTLNTTIAAAAKTLSGTGELVIQILYLRTYENAGLVKCFFCGVPVASLNALWEDHKTNRISIPDLRNLKVKLNACSAKNYTYPIIEFYHMNDKVDESMSHVVGNRKFKLVNIKVWPEQ